MMIGSVISAMTRSVPPHRGQTVTSNSKTRLSGASHDAEPRLIAQDHSVSGDLDGLVDSR